MLSIPSSFPRTWIRQNFVAHTNMRSVGVMGDERTYDFAVALRAVNTIDFMTAEAAQFPYEVLNKCISRIINEVCGVNRVMYDVTSKLLEQSNSNKFEQMTKTPENADKYGSFQGFIPFEGVSNVKFALHVFTPNQMYTDFNNVQHPSYLVFFS